MSAADFVEHNFPSLVALAALALAWDQQRRTLKDGAIRQTASLSHEREQRLADERHARAMHDLADARELLDSVSAHLQRLRVALTAADGIATSDRRHAPLADGVNRDAFEHFVEAHESVARLAVRFPDTTAVTASAHLVLEYCRRAVLASGLPDTAKRDAGAFEAAFGEFNRCLQSFQNAAASVVGARLPPRELGQ